MAKTPKAAETGDFRSIAWNLLIKSPKNVRVIPTDEDDKDFTADISRRGVLQSLLVRNQLDEARAPTGLFEVIAGGRRYDAVGRLVQSGRFTADIGLPCKVRNSGIAEEDSLAENLQRAPLHPLDQYRAFVALIENGLSEDEVAARFFVQVAIVRQRLKMATVSPVLLDAFGKNEMHLEQLMAFTINPDHARQEQVWEAISKTYNREPYHIRRLLSENTVKANDKRALFVGAAAYLEAGGVISRDLFEADQGGWFQDPLLLERLLSEKLTAEAEQLKGEGWLWIEAAVDHGYGHTMGMRQLVGAQPDLTEDEKAELDTLTNRFDALTAEYEDAEELPDEIDAEFGDLEAKIEAYQNRALVFDPAEVTHAGVFVSISNQGALRIERGYVRPEHEPAVEPDPAIEDGTEFSDEADRSVAHISTGAATEPPSPEDDEDGLKPLSDRLLADLTAYRTVALRNALAEQPRNALTLLLHKLCCDQFYRRPEGLNLDARIGSVGLLSHPGLSDSIPAEAITARNQMWLEQIPGDIAELWDWLNGQDEFTRLSLLAHCVSYGINALYQKPDRYGSMGPSAHTVAARMSNANHLAHVLALDINATGWRPTAANYFANVSKAHILRAVQEARGDDAVRRISGMKRGDMATEAETLLADTGWLPESLRTPVAVNDDPAGDHLHDQGLGEVRDEDGTAGEQVAHSRDNHGLEAAE